MRIYSMTATFGKLEHQTLTLEPGLNVIHAPNEWGKSTWCAFLLNMLYGIDTRERTKQDSLADKDRYAPWSGAAMSGRMEIDWNGRHITIERSSNARIPMGIFRAYETDTGIDIPELTAANCGQMLLGVERNVFMRAGFLRLADLPVTQDDALRRRLNNLVTTGDESGDADKLGQSLKELKNKCRSNKANGLLPEAEAQRDHLREQLWDLQDLTQQIKQLQSRQAELLTQVQALENHQAALDYTAAQRDAAQVLEARQVVQSARKHLEALQEAVRDLPSEEDAQSAFQTATALQEEMNVLLQQQQQLPEKPAQPSAPTDFENISPTDALQTAQADHAACRTLEKERRKIAGIITFMTILLAILCVGIIPAAVFLSQPLFSIIGGAVIAVGMATTLVVSSIRARKLRILLDTLYNRHPGQSPDTWVSNATRYAQDMHTYETELQQYLQQTEAFTRRQADFNDRLKAFTLGESLSSRQNYYEQALRQWQSLPQAREGLEQAERHAAALESMAKTARPPDAPDTLDHPPEETLHLLTRTRLALQENSEKLAQCKGQLEAMGQPSVIEEKLDVLNRRIARLETYAAAIEMAQDALYKTTLVLQRRFSPRITRRTQALFSKLTGNRYQRVTMGEDLSLQTATENEDTLKELRRRSDGTIDQLYLALRLAVAQELSPESPLILDDALVRFDDTRLALAMDILKEEAAQKQVIVFTCQGRESAYV